MASDGCDEVAWKGQAFSYFLHKEGMGKSENYGSQRAGDAAGGAATSTSHGGRTDTTARAGTGTWNGPAPRGSLHSGDAAAPAAAPFAIREPTHALLSNGARLPMIGFGTYRVESADAIKEALDVGYRHFDCAAMYQNQEVVGEGLAGFIGEGRREELFIVGKIWNTEHRPADARASVLRSLEQLRCSYLDLLMIHWPEAWLPGSDIHGEVQPDTSVTVKDTWVALEALVDEGLVRGLGIANASLAQVEELLGVGRHKPLVNQLELHPLLAQRKMVGVCLRKGVVCEGHSCLGRKSGEAGEDLMAHPTVVAVAEECGQSPARVLLKYNMQRGVPVLAKASTRPHMEDNLSGMFDWKLTNGQKATLDALDAGRRFIDYPWKQWGSAEEGGAAKPSVVLAGNKG